jgi:hypothetical protein
MSKILMPTDGKWYEPMSKTVPQSLNVISDRGDIQVFDYQPGNGTRYVVSMTRIRDAEAGDVMGARLGDTHMLVLHNIGTRRAVFVGGDTQYYDLNEKLGIGNADCLVLLSLIRYMAGDMSNLNFEGGVSRA